MIKKLLRAIRQKPKAVREQYAFWIACVLTSAVAAGWLMTTMGRFSVGELLRDSEETLPASDTLSDFLEDTQAQFSTAQEELQNLSPAAQSGSTSTSSSVSAVGGTSDVSTTDMSPAASVQEARIVTSSTSSTTSQSIDVSNE